MTHIVGDFLPVLNFTFILSYVTRHIVTMVREDGSHSSEDEEVKEETSMNRFQRRCLEQLEELRLGEGSPAVEEESETAVEQDVMGKEEDCDCRSKWVIPHCEYCVCEPYTWDSEEENVVDINWGLCVHCRKRCDCAKNAREYGKPMKTTLGHLCGRGKPDVEVVL